MSDLQLRIARIEELTTNLLSIHENVKEKNQILSQKVRELEADLFQKNSEIAQLEKELKTARVAQSIGKHGEDANLAKARISSLVREIDRCIALLNE